MNAVGVLKKPSQLNQEQRRAVELACRNDLTFVMIQGPPGTVYILTNLQQ